MAFIGTYIRIEWIFIGNITVLNLNMQLAYVEMMDVLIGFNIKKTICHFKPANISARLQVK
jgi:hypothetical protein